MEFKEPISNSRELANDQSRIKIMNEQGKPPMGERRVTVDQLPKEAGAENGMFDWDYFESHPEMIVPEALNNFHMAMPGGYKRTMLAEALEETPELADDPDQKRRLQLFKDIDSLYRLAEQEQHDAAVAVQNNIREKILPLYKKLREMGYTHRDLVI